MKTVRHPTLIASLSLIGFLLLMAYVLVSCAPPYPYGTQVVITPTPVIRGGALNGSHIERYYDRETGVVCYYTPYFQDAVALSCLSLPNFEPTAVK